jgi:hypothetical protein
MEEISALSSRAHVSRNSASFSYQYGFALGRKTISIEQKNVHVIVDLWFEDEGLHEWVDGEGTLDRILGLYDDMLVADYRSLFLL